jgi:hypothetical protein
MKLLNRTAPTPLLSPNIDTRGRVIRAFAALALGLGAAFTFRHSEATGIALGASSAFVALEAARGWCVARACGVKTKF